MSHVEIWHGDQIWSTTLRLLCLCGRLSSKTGGDPLLLSLMRMFGNMTSQEYSSRGTVVGEDTADGVSPAVSVVSPRGCTQRTALATDPLAHSLLLGARADLSL